MCKNLFLLTIICSPFLLAGLCSAAEPAADDCPFRTPTGCYTCNAPEVIRVGSKEECVAKCPNREVNSKGSGTGDNYVYNCVLKTCPPDKILRGYYGNCKSCDDPVLDEDSLGEQNCSDCSNRYKDKNGDCLFKDGTPLQKPQEFKKFPAQECPTDKPLQQWNNECFSCDTPRTIYVSGMGYYKNPDKFNAICPNRVIINSIGGERPSVLACPKEYPLIDYNGHCHACDEDMYLDLRWNENFCSRFCAGKRYIAEGRGVCRVCPQDKSKLNPRECEECGGKFIRGRCRI